jgi:hypothetical protein
VNATGQRVECRNGVLVAGAAGSAGSRPRHPFDVTLGVVALLECLAAPSDRGEDDTVRLATGASLLAAAVRPHLRVGALVSATLVHSLRTLALTLEPEARRQKGRLAVEAGMSAALVGLLHQAARAARWDR